ncbi:MAG: TonB-dependent receptor [Bacteroidetes bacterium]|nr:TonB-dependent receptor [Bacteroidota bacterium]
MKEPSPVRSLLWAVGLITLLVVPSSTSSGQVGSIEGRVLSSRDREPVEFALIHLEEIRRTAQADMEGAFKLEGVPAGHYTIHVTRIGFHPLSQVLDLTEGERLVVQLLMESETITIGQVTVESDRATGSALGVEHRMEGENLRQHLGTTIAETLDEEPGIAMRSMGPAPARPVMRGLGGERLLVLENGGRTGDLSQTSSDHALVIDPLTADRLEILRGPAALVHGSNTLGGAINVVRETILSAVPDGVHASYAIQGQSVSSGVAGGGGVSLPIGKSWALRAGGSHRRGEDVHTPEGRLKNTDLRTSTGTIGLSRVWSNGFVGASGSMYESGYGIPGGFIGAHPNGVSVDVSKEQAEVRFELLPSKEWLRRIEAVGSWTRYHHGEFESSGALGIEYGLLTWESRILAHTGHLGPFEHGAFGAWVEVRDYAAGGFSFTPPTMEQTVALFAFQDFHVGPNSVQIGARYDQRFVRPSETIDSDIGQIGDRDFGDVSASVSIERVIARGVTLSAMAMRSLRLPGIEELFSEGPHLAAYSFEVGNPDLFKEIGTGAEIAVRLDRSRMSGSIALFQNRFKDYLFPLNTGELNYRIYVPIYQFTGTDALMNGAEGQVRYQLDSKWSASATASYVRGTLTELDTPIPWMPPLRGAAQLMWDNGSWSMSASLRAAASQDRLGPFEEGTDGYLVPDISFEYHRVAFGMLQTFNLGVDNITNTSYRDHLSRVKSILPEPGRNVRLLYRAYF